MERTRRRLRRGGEQTENALSSARDEDGATGETADAPVTIIEDSQDVNEAPPTLPVKRTSPELVEFQTDTYTTEEPNDDSHPNPDRITDEPEERKKAKKARRPKKPKVLMPRQHKLLDYTDLYDSSSDYEAAPREDLDLPTRPKLIKPIASLLQRTAKKKDFLGSVLAKSVLQDHTEAESLVISTPQHVEGFTTRVQTKNPRDAFKEQLRTVINTRKTTHIDSAQVFDKPQTEFSRVDSSEAESLMPVDEKTIESNPETSAASLEEDKATQSLWYAKALTRSKFIEDMAELGSDDEDYVTKRESNHSEEESDEELAELIDNQPVKERTAQVIRKHVLDMVVQDRQDLMKVVNAEFRHSQPTDFSALKLQKAKQQQQPFDLPKTRTAGAVTECVVSDDEDSRNQSRLNLELRSFRSQSSLVIDDNSQTYLNMIEKPQFVGMAHSLLRHSVSRPFSNKARAVQSDCSPLVFRRK